MQKSFECFKDDTSEAKTENETDIEFQNITGARKKLTGFQE